VKAVAKDRAGRIAELTERDALDSERLRRASHRSARQVRAARCHGVFVAIALRDVRAAVAAIRALVRAQPQSSALDESIERDALKTELLIRFLHRYRSSKVATHIPSESSKQQSVGNWHVLQLPEHC
jgi:hypothetical protein